MLTIEMNIVYRNFIKAIFDIESSHRSFEIFIRLMWSKDKILFIN